MTSTNTRQKVERFRVLIIGNANAGKTTILEKVCHANGRKPYFLDAEGKEIESQLLKSSLERGEHDIEHQIVYPSAHGFIFHDSRGFEAGGTGELDKVREFVDKRAKQAQMKDQLHAVWYCLPTSNDRPLTKAEMSLFESGTGNSPVIAVFTKMDALDKKVFSEQMNKGIDPRKAREQVPSMARAKFEHNFLEPLKKATHQPQQIVELREMNKPDKDCDDLLKATARALDGRALELLLLTAQRNDVEFSIKQVIIQHIIPLAQVMLDGGSFTEKEAKSLLQSAMTLFPHSLPSFKQKIQQMDKNAIKAMDENIVQQRARLFAGFDGFAGFDRQQNWDFRDNKQFEECFTKLLLFIPSISTFTNHHCDVIITGTAIIFALVSSLFSSTTTYFLQHFSTTLESLASSLSFKNLVATVQNGFQQSQFVTEKDGELLFGFFIANPLFADILFI